MPVLLKARTILPQKWYAVLITIHMHRDYNMKAHFIRIIKPKLFGF